MTVFSHTQKQILQKLLTKYESSKTYKGENSVSQSFSIKPADVFGEYERDSSDINEVEDFEKQCGLLEGEKLIHLEWKYERLTKITAISTGENWNKIRTILGVKDKNARLQEEIAFYSWFFEDSDSEQIVKDFCFSQIERLTAGKDAQFEKDEAENIIRLLNFILQNKNEILERELSVSVLANTKLWEEKYKARVLKILRQSGRFDALAETCSGEKEQNKVILEECNVFSNPSYIYFKGNAKITFDNGNCITVSPDVPFALFSPAVHKIVSFEVADSKIMTVENLTSFNRINEGDAFCIFLSGYHNSAKQDFLKKLSRQNQGKAYFHFGDIDPDGFFILENLRSKTGIDFKSYKMGIEELKKYADFAKPLEKNDVTKAKTLIENGKYTEVMEYMLEKNVKLEQEIVSWKER